MVKTFWALDACACKLKALPFDKLAQQLFALSRRRLSDWYKKNVGEEFVEDREEAMRLLQREAELKDIVQLVGEDALPDSEKLLLEIGRMIREDFLRQSAFDEIDAYTSLKKQKHDDQHDTPLQEKARESARQAGCPQTR